MCWLMSARPKIRNFAFKHQQPRGLGMTHSLPGVCDSLERAFQLQGGVAVGAEIVAPRWSEEGIRVI